jgi:FkbM family methyltransferase
MERRMDLIKNWILNNLPKDSTILEAGVADGSDTLFFARHFPNGKIYGFEPHESILNQAIEKVKHYNNVVLEQKALDHEIGQKEFYISDRFGDAWGSSSLLEPKDHLWFHKEITFKTTETVEAVCFDDWITENKIEKIDLAWLDMQGYEPLLLKNSPLAMSKIEYLYTEVSLIETYSEVTKYEEYKSMLLESGFEVVFEDLPWQDMGNVLFKKGNDNA